jgi:hypothetical protein
MRREFFSFLFNFDTLPSGRNIFLYVHLDGFKCLVDTSIPVFWPSRPVTPFLAFLVLSPLARVPSIVLTSFTTLFTSCFAFPFIRVLSSSSVFVSSNPSTYLLPLCLLASTCMLIFIIPPWYPSYSIAHLLYSKTKLRTVQ